MTESRSLSSRVLPGIVLLLVVGVVTYVVAWRSDPPTGPADLVWDKTACAECRMHIGEPAFAAQMRLASGAVVAFDDPGCLFEHLDELQQETVTGTWFHHLRDDRWVSADDVSFVTVAPTPMGYGLGAVAAGERDDAISLPAARQRVLDPDGGR